MRAWVMAMRKKVAAQTRKRVCFGLGFFQVASARSGRPMIVRTKAPPNSCQGYSREKNPFARVSDCNSLTVSAKGLDAVRRLTTAKRDSGPENTTLSKVIAAARVKAEMAK